MERTIELEKLIETRKLTTDEIYENFKDFVKTKGLQISYEDFEDFKEYFQNLETNSTNYKMFLEFIKNK